MIRTQDLKIGNYIMNKKKCIISALAMIIITIMLIVIGKGVNSKKYTGELISKTAFYLDTFVTVQVYDCEENYSASVTNADEMYDLVENAVNLCGKYELIFSKKNADSEVYKFNNSDKTDVEISKELYNVIDKSLHYSKISDGKFDITVSKLSDVWNFKNEIVPDEATIAEALNTVNYENISLAENNGKYYLTVNGSSELDLGSIAKGFIADEIKEYLTSNGIQNGMINLGGNMIAIGNKPDGSSYNIGIQKPFSSEADLICTVIVNDKTIVTSGIYERMFEQGGKIYHHIIDPINGYPSDTGIYSATIIAEKSVDADALSTVCVLLGTDKAIELINSIDDVECVIVDENYKIWMSDGVDNNDGVITLK